MTTFEERERRGEKMLYAETIPKLWDMADEEAEAVMKQSCALARGAGKNPGSGSGRIISILAALNR